MIHIAISPGSMGVVGHAIYLFGAQKVNPGTWTSPVYVNGLSKDEASFAKEFFGELGLSVSEISPAYI